jgi:ethanolamine utilization protein EutQ (cupin superfamily)
MIVSGSLQTQMKDDKAFVAHHGDFVYMPRAISIALLV